MGGARLSLSVGRLSSTKDIGVPVRVTALPCHLKVNYSFPAETAAARAMRI
jgi:hypothetical protein